MADNKNKNNCTESEYLQLSSFWLNSSAPSLHQFSLSCHKNTVFITGIGVSVRAWNPFNKRLSVTKDWYICWVNYLELDTSRGYMSRGCFSSCHVVRWLRIFRKRTEGKKWFLSHFRRHCRIMDYRATGVTAT